MIRGTTFPAGKIVAPGHVQWDVKGDTTLGPFEPRPATREEVRRLADACTRAGMPTNSLKHDWIERGAPGHNVADVAPRPSSRDLHAGAARAAVHAYLRCRSVGVQRRHQRDEHGLWRRLGADTNRWRRQLVPVQRGEPALLDRRGSARNRHERQARSLYDALAIRDR